MQTLEDEILDQVGCSEDGTTRIECFENLLGILVGREIDDNELQKLASTAGA